jgi:hypothetical protein
VRKLKDGGTAIGYIEDDFDCPNPLEDCDGFGRIYRRDRDAGPESKDMFDKETGRKAGFKANKYAVLLDKYEHGQSVWSVAGEGMECKWDTSRDAGVWVPDDSCLEHIKGVVKAAGSLAEIRNAAGRQEASKCAREACELYTQWCNGECYGFAIDIYNKDGEFIDSESFGGYVGYDNVIASLTDTIDLIAAHREESVKVGNAGI